MELRFSPATRLEVYDARSALVAVGTEQHPVVFTSERAVPAPGDWTGLSFQEPQSQNRLEHVRVRYAGGDCQCSSYGCNYLPGSFSVASAILLFEKPATAFITHTHIEHSAGHGILRGVGGDVGRGLPGHQHYPPLGVLSAASGRLRRTARIPSMTNAMSVAACAAAKGGSVPLGASACNGAILRKA
ncbi:hypothetical protein CYFUS_008231 [Cystobacter fuscus]|uniref:Uncharacterized protein n=1 Tax=Cystobacter fuscus TaxID=43 RepID=A0A250JGZ1_9BACT|nr:hypothetical protein CYFUS_008231 [Cystobacter fuscus]